MAKTSIKNETVYVVYYNGVPFESYNYKIAYADKKSARQIITTASKLFAQEKQRQDRENNGFTLPDWYLMSDQGKLRLVELEKENFDIVEYVPKQKFLTANR